MRRYLSWACLVAVLMYAMPAQSQGDIVEKFKVKKSIKKAKKAVKSGNYYVATDLYEKILEVKPEKLDLALKAAQSYEASRDYRNAEKWYKHLVDNDASGMGPVGYKYAMMMKMNGKYDEAITAFEKFQKEYRGDDASTYRRFVKDDIEGCKFAKQSMKAKVPVEVTHLDDKVNSAYTDISPMIWVDSSLLFASLPVDTFLTYDPKKEDFDYFVKFFHSKITEEGYEQAEKFPMFDIEDRHSSNGALSPDGKRFYFTICEQIDVSNIICKIHVSKYENGTWLEPEPLDDKINQEGTTNTHPSIAVNDRGEEIIYFASNRDRGRGGMDIWFTKIDKRGNYRNPRNCGSKVNTKRNEAMPFYNMHNGHLYFSSDGHPGMGGYDIFKIKGYESRYTTLENMGHPINSSCDDMYCFFDYKDESGYFVSNRPGIISLKHETCCDDIFRFEYDNTVRLAVKGLVFDEADSTRTPLDDCSVNLMLQTEERTEDVVISEDSTLNGNPFFFNLNPENNYRLAALRTGYLSGSTTLSTLGMTRSDTMYVEIFLKKYEINKAYKLSNIYYAFDKWDILPESENTLDTLYNIMIENPNIIVELSSHTDARGTNEYNEDLSQKRAESCVNYLIKKGIEEERIVPKGYGEEQLLDDCFQYEECGQTRQKDCPCHQKNRRTEFKITGEMKGELIYDDEF